MYTTTLRVKKYLHASISFESRSFQLGEKWFNCLYINFHKESYPNLKYPKLVDGWRKGERRFDYYNSDLAELDWHGGITFYEEKMDLASGLTLVKAGCDYQHLYDDHFMEGDHGEAILLKNADPLLSQFLELAGKDPHH